MPEPLRILQIVDSLQPGGMENVLVQLLGKLDPDRFLPEVCCLVQSGPFQDRLPARVKVHALGKPPGFQWATVAKLRRLLKEGSFDLVHTHHLGGLIYTALAAPIPWQRPKVVHSEHSLWSGEDLTPRRLWQRHFLYRRADSVFSVSRQQLNQIQSHGLGHPRVQCILNGVDCDRFFPVQDKAELRRRLGLDPHARWLGMVARFGPQKRHWELIEAFDAMAGRHPAVNLLLVGDRGPEKERALRRIEESPFKARIKWVGFQQDPVPWYQAMDALVISSSNEGLPNAVLEAMATGMPVIANDVCGVREIARAPEHGWVGDYGTVPSLSAALVDAAMASEDLLQECGRAARQHVQQTFSIDAMVRAYDRLYSSLAP